ncbi:cytochrome c biogenesis CcdA family protein [Gordonia amicalis]|uniref:Cytochrome c biogenesis CcdA family protein n=1 Tax=Gordonia amicalis TaxID=89053 RepID=A0ABU4DD17_9ACTN|nr:cytochrome c biogenesis CcdA family protein [Gordonia amicalis]MDV6307633.1 cytochrome c biogenesis CcdA family protein [Gordonia amicalis]MDV7099394.1 cytochrome c biogenesis CcdA family protein [Gordonia amicalis]
MDVGLIAAFAGGVLALLSPCGALLLPAFFASSVGARGRLVVHAAIFYAGLLITLLPVGMGVGALASRLTEHRSTIIAVAALLIVMLGVLQLFGRGFDLGRLVPGMSRVQQQSMARTGLVKTLLLGAVSGVTGFCTGPILGAVITMAASRGIGGAALLLAVYALGMVVPLLILAVLWTRIGEAGRARLRGREVSLGRLRLHTTHLIAGGLLIAVGVVFWLTNGFVGAPEPIGIDAQGWLQNAAGMLATPIVDIIAIAVLATVVLNWWWRRSSRARVVGRPDATGLDDEHPSARSVAAEEA